MANHRHDNTPRGGSIQAVNWEQLLVLREVAPVIFEHAGTIGIWTLVFDTNDLLPVHIEQLLTHNRMIVWVAMGTVMVMPSK